MNTFLLLNKHTLGSLGRPHDNCGPIAGDHSPWVARTCGDITEVSCRRVMGVVERFCRNGS